jgi:hypothetical protein
MAGKKADKKMEETRSEPEKRKTERDELFKKLQAVAEYSRKLAMRIENEEFDEETYRRLEYIGGQLHELIKLGDKIREGNELTNEEANLFLDTSFLGDEGVINKILKPPDTD